LIDGRVAGTAFPYATIFTGGIVPTAWRPITSYGAIDLPTYFLDVTPFVPLLTDGKAHTFTIDVASAENDHATLQNWFVSGNLQVITDTTTTRPTTGRITLYEGDPFAQTSTVGSVGANGDVQVTVKATRRLRVEAEIVSGSGRRSHVAFSQNLQYSNLQQYLQNADIQNVFQTATGQVSSTHNGQLAVLDDFSYPLNINFTILNANGSDFKALFDHSYNRDLLPSPVITRSNIQERQLASGFFHLASTGNTGNGTNSNIFRYKDAAGNTFNRQVNAVLNNITLDIQSGNLAPAPALKLPAGQQIPFSSFAKPRLPGLRHGIEALVDDLLGHSLN